MKNKIDFEILNYFVNLILFDVAQKYLGKLKKDGKNPPRLIEEYLDNSIKLLNKYKTIEISKMKNTIEDINSKEQREFKELFKKYQGYEELCKELNFAYLLMIDSELQEKTISLIYDNLYEYKILIDQDLITKRQVSISKVIEQSKTKELNKLRDYNNYDANYIYI